MDPKRFFNGRGLIIKQYFARIFIDISDRFGKLLFWVVFALLTVNGLWCFGAYFHAFDIPEFVAWCASIMLAASMFASIFYPRVLLIPIVLQLVTVSAFRMITPSERFNNTVWQQPWRQTLEVRRTDDGIYHLRNVRDFRYRTENDFDVRYRSMTVSPDRISSIDIVFSHWDNMEQIAHSMLGMNFSDGTELVISLETRLPVGAQQNGLDGLYRRYGLAMIAGTPEDLYGLRVDHRGETLYVYRMQNDHETLREMTISIFERAAEMQRRPVFYNSLFRNCTTGLLPMLPMKMQPQKNLRILINGQAAKLLYDSNQLCHRENESFGSLRARSLVPGLCCGKNAPPARYCGESESGWLRNH